jgi:hypothetical protein
VPVKDGDHDCVTSRQGKGWAQASLRIFGDAITVETITERLGIEPDFGGNAGTPGPGRSTRPTTLWGLNTRLSDDHLLNEHIHDLLARLDGRDDALASLADECRVEIFAGVFSDNGQAGETLPWLTLKALSDRRIDLDLDLYPAEAHQTDVC